MIQSVKDYRFYLESDRIALFRQSKRPKIGDYVWKFERLLRRFEYYTNCRNSGVYRPYLLLLKYKFHRFSVKLGYTIPPNTFGPGLSIVHYGTIIVNPYARIGENCRLHALVSIGTQPPYGNRAPKIGKNCFIGPGARIYGNIEIADNIAIGANSVVRQSFLEPGITIAGVPARKVKDVGSENIVIDATASVRGGKKRDSMQKTPSVNIDVDQT